MSDWSERRKKINQTKRMLQVEDNGKAQPDKEKRIEKERKRT